jgi:hypothetical protein
MIERDPHVRVADVIMRPRVVHDLDARCLRGRTNIPFVHIIQENVGVTSLAGKPLLAIDDPLFTVANRVRLEQVGSEPPWGSVIEYGENMSWFICGYSQRRFCSSVP